MSIPFMPNVTPNRAQLEQTIRCLCRYRDSGGRRLLRLPPVARQSPSSHPLEFADVAPPTPEPGLSIEFSLSQEIAAEPGRSFDVYVDGSLGSSKRGEYRFRHEPEPTAAGTTADLAALKAPIEAT